MRWRRVEPEAQLFIEGAEIALVGFPLFVAGGIRGPFEGAHEFVGENEVGGKPVPQTAFAGCLRFCGDAEAGIRLAQAHASQKRDIGDALGEADVTLSRAHGALEIGLQPMQPGTEPHRVIDPLLFGQKEPAGVPGGDQSPVQRLARGLATLPGLFVQAVDFLCGGGRRDRVHSTYPVVSRKLSAS